MNPGVRHRRAYVLADVARKHAPTTAAASVGTAALTAMQRVVAMDLSPGACEALLRMTPTSSAADENCERLQRAAKCQDGAASRTMDPPDAVLWIYGATSKAGVDTRARRRGWTCLTPQSEHHTHSLL